MAGLVNVAIQDGPRPEFAPAARPLPRILYALALTPGHKFGSMEEQILVLAERFRAEHSLFLPLLRR